MGDFNFPAKGEGCFFVGNSAAATNSDFIPGASVRPWQAILDSMIEFNQKAPTHFVTPNMPLMRLDRIYTSAPSWMLASL